MIKSKHHNKSNKSNSFSQKNQRFSDVDRLEVRIKEETPVSGDYFYDYKLEEAKKEESILKKDDFHKKYKINFSDLPISSLALKGLNKKTFTKMTEVQRCVVPHALGGRDIMAASRTGSGKTLAYLLPLIQKLYRNRFMPIDGLGAIVLVPVRELAMQVFEVLNSFTGHMEISVGLIIGGKNLKYEQEKIGNMNILICTPGRLLQHLQQTYGFETNNLQMLVLDEADVMLEMGFRNTLKSILENIPKCQTLFFSATLNNDIHKLSETCMTNPERVFLHTVNINNKNKGSKGAVEEDKSNQKRSINDIYQTPAKLMQYYMVVKAEQKLNVLYSFLKTHNKQKILIFTSTCKQVRFIYESFKKFRIGCPMYELQGHQKQKKRMAIYFTFCQKKYGILVCTNIASRGLDFPMVDWVVQMDLPQDVETYVHRVGRTARFKYDGKALAFVTDQQQGFIDKMKEKNMNIHKITQNPEKYFQIQSSLQSICSQHQDVKYLAQKALMSYLQFMFKCKNKLMFDINKLDLDKLALSYGLQNAPKLSLKSNQQENGEVKQEDPAFKNLTKIEKLRLKAKLAKKLKKIQGKNLEKTEEDQQDQENQIEEQSSQEDDDEQSVEQQQQSQQQDLFKIKKTIKLDQNDKPILSVSKNQLKKIKPDGHFEGRNKIIFDKNLNRVSFDEYRVQNLLTNNKKNVNDNQNFQNQIQERLQQNKALDEKVQKDRRKLRRKKLSLKGQQNINQKQQAYLNDSQDDQE